MGADFSRIRSNPLLDFAGVELKQGGVVRPEGTLTRKEAANLLGMNDTEFALRLIWDSRFPKPVRGAFRAGDIRAWLKTQRIRTARK